MDFQGLLELEFPIALSFFFKAILDESFQSSPAAHLVLIFTSFITTENFQIHVFEDTCLGQHICVCLPPLLLAGF